MSWTITRGVLAQIEAHAREARPAECCGVLIGRPGTIASSRRVRNLSDDPNRFELDPQGHVGAIRETRGTQETVVGFYHSHPHSAPIPSARDVAESTYPDAIHLIIGVGTVEGQLETRAYYLRDATFEAIALEIVAGDRPSGEAAAAEGQKSRGPDRT
ncbi:MAG: Mov34/MPN/PAD-1 family protein [Vicinamibacterales bacterium]